VKLSGKIVRDEINEEEELDEEELMMRHLDPRIMETPTFAVNTGIEETVNMGLVTMHNYDRICTEVLKDKPSKSRLERISSTEEFVNDMETMSSRYFVQVSTLAITEKQRIQVNNLHFVIHDIERIGDYVKSIASSIERNASIGGVFSESAKQDLEEMCSRVKDCIECALNSVGMDDEDMANRTIEIEDEIDQLERKVREKHINRLTRESCKVESGVIYMDIVNSLEKIADHANNIAKCVKNEQMLHN
jgi:phosphate:Na+ symporter